jgi:hypothetical protein
LFDVNKICADGLQQIFEKRYNHYLFKVQIAFVSFIASDIIAAWRQIVLVMKRLFYLWCFEN